jgi:hypothetical protein
LPETPLLLLFKQRALGFGNHIGISIQSHGVGLADDDALECPAVTATVGVHEEVCHQHHRLQRRHGGTVEVRAQMKSLVACRGVKFRSVRLVGRRNEGVGRLSQQLGAQGQHDKQEGHEGRVDLGLAGERKAPKVFIKSVEVSFVKDGEDGVDGIEVLGDQDVSLMLGGEDGYDFLKATRQCPVVLEWMFVADAIDVDRTECWIRYIA